MRNILLNLKFIVCIVNRSLTFNEKIVRCCKMMRSSSVFISIKNRKFILNYQVSMRNSFTCEMTCFKKKDEKSYCEKTRQLIECSSDQDRRLWIKSYFHRQKRKRKQQWWKRNQIENIFKHFDIINAHQCIQIWNLVNQAIKEYCEITKQWSKICHFKND